MWWEDEPRSGIWTSPTAGDTALRAVRAAREAVRRFTSVPPPLPDPPDDLSGADAV